MLGWLRLVLKTNQNNSAKMKTLHILVLALAITFAPVIGHAHENNHVDSIAHKIQSAVTLPASCQDVENQRVFVVFSIAENGAVAVHEVGTLNAELKASIISQFQAMQFDITYNGMYSIWLN